MIRLHIVVLLLSSLLVLGCQPAGSQPVSGWDASNLVTFTSIGKQQPILEQGREVELVRHSGKGCLTHMWFAMDERTRVRVYVDGEAQPSIDMALDLGHGYAFGGPPEPWGNQKMGRFGGQFNNYRVPFSRGVRITLLPTGPALDRATGREAWWIIRGTDNLPTFIGGLRLPDSARLRLHRIEDYHARPLEEFTMCDAKTAGILYQVTIAAKGEHKSNDWKDLSFMEGCLRAYIDGQAAPQLLSSGFEDYFLGSGYFHQNQRYYGSVAGLTHVDKENNAFCAYRFHDDDPIVFHSGLKLTCRCGEQLGGFTYYDPPPARYTTYVWTYEW